MIAAKLQGSSKTIFVFSLYCRADGASFQNNHLFQFGPTLKPQP